MENLLSIHTLEATIKSAIYDESTKQLIVSGDHIPNQTINDISWEDWHTVLDINGKPALDIQIWKESEDEFGIQFVSLEIDVIKSNALKMKSNYKGISSTNEPWHKDARFVVTGRNKEIETQYFIFGSEFVDTYDEGIETLKQEQDELGGFIEEINPNELTPAEILDLGDGWEKYEQITEAEYRYLNGEGFNLFEVVISYNDDPENESKVLMCEVDGIPEGYTDDQIYFYGISEQNIIADMESGEYGSDGWKIHSYGFHDNTATSKDLTEEEL